MEFVAWPKTPRLFRTVTVTEKIDGTNACVIVEPDGSVGAQSRKRLITPESDNAGFAQWVATNRDFLASVLGPGRHYGEWWGSGIQRGYGLTNGDKRLSLFNTDKWSGLDDWDEAKAIGLGSVPVIRVGELDTTEIRMDLECLAEFGSYAADGYDRPEGICIFHHASRQVFKATLDGDLPKETASVAVVPAAAGNVTPISPNGTTILPRDYATAV